MQTYFLLPMELYEKSLILPAAMYDSTHEVLSRREIYPSFGVQGSYCGSGMWGRTTCMIDLIYSACSPSVEAQGPNHKSQCQPELFILAQAPRYVKTLLSGRLFHGLTSRHPGLCQRAVISLECAACENTKRAEITLYCTQFWGMGIASLNGKFEEQGILRILR